MRDHAGPASATRLSRLPGRESGQVEADEAMLAAAADEAIEESIASGQESAIGMPHLQRALQQIKPTTLEWLTSARNHARYANQGGQYDDVLKFLENQR